MAIITQSYFWSALLAAIGGVLVSVFIALEIVSEKKWYANAKSMNRWGSIKKIAEWMVVGSVAFESIIAGCAAKTEWQTRHSVSYMQRIRFDEPNLREILTKFRKGNGVCPVRVVIVSSFENESLKASNFLIGHFLSAWGGVDGPHPQVVLMDGVEIESAMQQKTTNDESQAAAFYLLQALTDENEVAFMMPGEDKIPENVIVVKVGPKPSEADVQTDINKAKFFINQFKNSKDLNVKNEYEVDRYSEVVNVKAETAKNPN